MIENNQRREGIIVKPDRIINSDGRQVDFNSDVVNKNTIYPFVYQQAKVLSDTILSNSFNYLSKSLHLFRTHKIPASSLIDFESTAKYFALSTIFGGQHNHMPANFPFYFNPVTTLLEPIGYDSNVARNIERYGGMITSPNNAYHSAIFIKSGVVTNLFNSGEFYTLYIRELKRMTEKNYIPSLFATIKKELNTNLAILYKEYPYFDFFKRDFISANKNYVKKHSTTFMGNLTYEYNGSQKNTSVTPGNYLTLDWGVGQYVTSNIEIAMVGYFQKQITSDDLPSDSQVPNQRSEAQAIGSEVSGWWGRQWKFTGRLLYEYEAKARQAGYLGTFNFTYRPR